MPPSPSSSSSSSSSSHRGDERRGVATFRRVLLPAVARDDGGDDLGGEARRGAWDRPVGLDCDDVAVGLGGESSSSGRVVGPRLITPNAVARGNVVLGWRHPPPPPSSLRHRDAVDDGNENDNDEDHREDDEGGGGGGWRWRTTTSSAVSSIAESADGRLIAAATRDGGVHLLRGSDGAVLASRSMPSNNGACGGKSSSSSSSYPPAEPMLLFLSGEGGGGGDVLVIVRPPQTMDDRRRRREGRSSSSSSSEVVLIGNAIGSLLDSSDPRDVQEGMAGMTANVLPLPGGASSTPPVDDVDDGDASSGTTTTITWMEGSFVGPATMRFFAGLRRGDGGGRDNAVDVASVWDYDVATGTTRVVVGDLGRSVAAAGGRCIRGTTIGGNDDDDAAAVVVANLVGMGMDSYHRSADDDGGDGGRYLLAIATATAGGGRGCGDRRGGGSGGGTTTTTTSLLWIDAVDLSVAGTHVFPGDVASVASVTPLRPPRGGPRDGGDAGDGGGRGGEFAVAAAVAVLRRGAAIASDDGGVGEIGGGAARAEIRVVQTTLARPSPPREEGGGVGGEEGATTTAATTATTTTTPPQADAGNAAALFVVEDVCRGGGRVVAVAPAGNGASYAFRCLVGSARAGGGGQEYGCWEFAPNGESAIGAVHGMLARRDFVGAHSLLGRMTTTTTTTGGDGGGGGRVSTPITESFVSLLQFRHVLSSYRPVLPPSSNEGGDDDDVASMAKECLKRIARGVVLSGGGAGEVGCMCDAAGFLMTWPKNMVADCDYGDGGPRCDRGRRCENDYDDDGKTPPSTFSIQEVRAALSAMSRAVSGVVDVVGPSNRGGAAPLEEQRRRLDERATALWALQVVVPSLDVSRVAADDPFLAVASIEDLLFALVARGAFKLVQKLLRTTLACGNDKRGRAVSSLMRPDVISSSALRIPMDVHPRSFIPWLCDVVIPSVAVGSKLMRQIHSWAVNAADYYDESNDDVVDGIDASIMLLTVREDFCFSTEKDGPEHSVYQNMHRINAYLTALPNPLLLLKGS